MAKQGSWARYGRFGGKGGISMLGKWTKKINIPDAKICRMDGDRYLVRIPSLRTYNAILKSQGDDFFDDGGSQCLVRRRDGRSLLVYQSRMLENVLLKCPYPAGALTTEIESYRDMLWLFPVRLMLEPLDADGYVSHEMEINPDGSIVEGGCLYETGIASLDETTGATVGGIRVVEVGKEKNLPTLTMTDRMFLGDTSDDAAPIEWVFSGGRLISRYCLFMASLRTLLQGGYIISQEKDRY